MAASLIKPARLAMCATLCLVGMAGAPAALIDRGGGLIYDTTLNITWLADWNYAKTSGVDADGIMTRDRATYVAVHWAVYGGYDDWRLPTVAQPDASCSNQHDTAFGRQGYGYNCTGNEMGHLFYADLGGKAGESVLNQTGDTAQEIANLALFTNVQSGWYWSGSLQDLGVCSYWFFDTRDGYQATNWCGNTGYALLVRPGDVASAVPQASTLALVGIALLGAAATRRVRPAAVLRRGPAVCEFVTS